VLAALQQAWQGKSPAPATSAAANGGEPDEYAGSPIVAAAMAAKNAAGKYAASVASSYADSPIVAAAMAAKKAAANSAAASNTAASNATASNATASNASHSQPSALKSGTRTIFSFVVDAEPRFAHEGYHLARSLIRHSCDQPADINVQFTREVDAHTRGLFRDLGCTLHDIERFGDGRYCNKIAQLANLHRFDFDHVVLLDTDMIAVADIRPFLGEQALVAKVVDIAEPPLAVLEEIARAAGMRNLPPVGTADIEYVATYSGHCNAGFYGIPKALAEIVDRSWRNRAQWLIEHDEPLKRTGTLHRIDQVSMWLAIVMDRIPYRTAPSNVNYYVPTDSEHRYLDASAGIALIRYDEAKLNALGKLEPHARHNPFERRAIEAANEQIGEGVDSAAFRNLRVAQS
jgi:hypothetical protein